MRFDQVKRREFITLLSGTVACPVAARAQHLAKSIGLLGAGSASLQSPWTGAFLQRLRELGWIEGGTISIAYRWADGSNERAAELAAELVRLKVDVIVTNATPTVLAAKRATTTIPIVFASAGDPLGGGLVASLPRPGGNITGLSLQLLRTMCRQSSCCDKGCCRSHCHRNQQFRPSDTYPRDKGAENGQVIGRP
jgi:putative tryptophan/tyrosine transport system substrate-binding protein